MRSPKTGLLSVNYSSFCVRYQRGNVMCRVILENSKDQVNYLLKKLPFKDMVMFKIKSIS